MNSKVASLVIITSVAAVALVLVLNRPAETKRPPLDVIQEALDQDAAKGRFTGRLGDFFVYGLVNGASPREAENVQCLNETIVVTDQAATRAHELSSDVFGPQGGTGWSCGGGGDIVVVNSGGGDGHEVRPDGADLGRYYFRTPFLKVVRDAPLDRLEVIQVEGHPALVQHPVKGYPYPVVSLAVIERFPDGDVPGIAVSVGGDLSLEQAIELAEKLMP